MNLWKRSILQELLYKNFFPKLFVHFYEVPKSITHNQFVQVPNSCFQGRYYCGVKFAEKNVLSNALTLHLCRLQAICRVIFRVIFRSSFIRVIIRIAIILFSGYSLVKFYRNVYRNRLLWIK